MRYESDYLDDLEQIEVYVRRDLLSKDREGNITKVLDLLEAEKCLELEALKDAEAVMQSDEEDYQSRNK